MLQASQRLDRDLTAIQAELDRHAGELRAVEQKIHGSSDSSRGELEKRRLLIEREIHALQTKLGAGQAQLAAMNQEITAANRHLQAQPSQTRPGAAGT